MFVDFELILPLILRAVFDLQDQNNLGAVRLLYEKNLQVRRSLAENHAEPNGVRRTQEATRQLVTFRNCTFSENTFIQATDDSLDYGIMILSNGDNDAILENCLFVNNAFSSNDPRVCNNREFSVTFIITAHIVFSHEIYCFRLLPLL
jgi:hypothetical protein